MDYEINDDTQIILKIDDNLVKIVETDDEILLNTDPLSILKHSCEYFGSSFEGRKEGTKKLLGITHKSPIIVEESNKLIFFPTTSPENKECIWVNLSKVNKIYKTGHQKSKILFKNGFIYEFNVSYGSLSNQVLRATRLKYILEERLLKKEDNY